MQLRFLALCALALISCTPRPDARDLACNPVDGVEQVLTAPGVFIGDMHGTHEAPAFLRDLSCQVMKSGQSLVIAMEYDARDQHVLDAFLDTADAEQASQSLTDTLHWTTNMDGRASAAMRDALLAIREYAREGGNARLLAYDAIPREGQGRDAASAELLARERARDPDAFWILFGGNVHARKVRGMAIPGYEDLEPLGYLLRDWNLIHLDIRYRGGTSWGCAGPDLERDCRIMDLGPACTTDCPAHAAIHLVPRRPEDAYDGYYEVGKLTASPPLQLQLQPGR